jgi:steroid 5-alpha reductase family enzyme
MQAKTRYFETANNTYYIKYVKISKTTYEQKQVQKEKLLYFAIQKSLGLLLIMLCIIMSLIIKDSEFTGLAIITIIALGLPLMIVNKRILNF